MPSRSTACESLASSRDFKQQFARSLGRVIEAVAGEIFRNIGVDEPGFALTIDMGVALGDRRLAGAQRLHLSARQREPGFECLADFVMVARLAVVGDDLEIRLLLFGHCFVA